mmetsp:Transcript_25640/g.41285  ORF Transcript_25640/g.41285 Transcript_25640/m.41285 type:complete len:137 (+) Transcript_25640:126-536(+)
MQALQSNASDLSGVAQGDAFKIDEVNLFERLGKEVFVKLSTNFYNRVYADSEQWFVDIFAGKPKEASIQNQYEFFIQRMGGPALYSERKGHPALIGRHMEFNISKQSAERWIEIMVSARVILVGVIPNLWTGKGHG